MKLSVIGLHASFADADHIDRFERFVYQGKAQGHLVQPSVYAACSTALEQLAQQQGLSLADINAIVVCDLISSSEKARLKKKLRSLHCVSTLAAALQIAEEQELSAVVGVKLCQEATLPVLNTISLDQSFAGYSEASGTAAVLLASASYCRRYNACAYAHIMAYASGDDMRKTCQQALQAADCSSQDIQYLEVSALADAAQWQAEADAVRAAYQAPARLHTALGSIRALTGEGGCFSQLAGLLKTILALHQRYYPGMADWQQPLDEPWQNTVFYMPVEARPWFPADNGKPAMAAYSCMTAQDYCHIVLAENSDNQERSNGYLACSDLVMIPLTAADQNSLQQQLQQLDKSITEKNLRSIAVDAYQRFSQQKNIYTLCLLAESAEELHKEIQLAMQGMEKAFAEQGEWKTPKGSYFTAEPVGDNDGVTFLYPGIGATYVGLGRDIFHLFPEIWNPVAALADNIGDSLKDSILNPRSIHRLGFHELKAIDHELRNSLANIAECGVGFACVFTKIFEDVFQLKADFSTGYSMGEISMYAALGCWVKPGVMSKRLAASDTFNHRLTGELQTLRQHWDLPAAKEGQIEQLWETYTLKATPEQIAEAAADEDRVYCTIINTPDSLVIGGYPEACQRVIKKLGVRAMPLDMPNAIHSAPAFKEYEHMEKLYTMDVNARIDTRLYSSSCYLPVPQRSKAIANSIAKCLCDPVDFPRLVNVMYDKGARVFIEMGPGRSLCSWVEKILKHDEHRSHVSVPVNAKGTSDELTILRAIAKLVSHGVPMNISKLYHGSLLTECQAARLNGKAV